MLHLSLDSSTLPLILTLLCWELSKATLSTSFWIFGITRPGTEPRSPGPLENTLTIMLIARYHVVVCKLYSNTVSCSSSPMMTSYWFFSPVFFFFRLLNIIVNCLKGYSWSSGFFWWCPYAWVLVYLFYVTLHKVKSTRSVLAVCCSQVCSSQWPSRLRLRWSSISNMPSDFSWMNLFGIY